MFSVLLRHERRRVLTDAFLILMLTMPPVVALLLRIYWPALDDAFPQWNIEQYKPAMSALIALLTPMMMGLVLGFNLLTDREQGLFSAIRVTPAGLKTYIASRATGYLVVSVVTTPLIHELLGFVDLSYIQLVMVCLFAQPLLPFSALILLKFARNLVEGFATMKATGFLITVPVIVSMFVPEPWYRLAALLPTWWTLWGYFEVSAGVNSGMIWLVLGAVLQLAISLKLWKNLLQQVD